MNRNDVRDIKLTVKVENAGDIGFDQLVNVEEFGEIARSMDEGSAAFQADDGLFYIIPTPRIWRVVGRRLTADELAARDAASVVAAELA